ncbi:ankyrin repeat-containing domain protein, partial [Baffinella frigidus]
ERGQREASALHAAAEAGNETMVLLLLAYFADLSARDIDGKTPLQYAICRGHVAVSQVLLQHGADVSNKDNESRTPLHYSS